MRKYAVVTPQFWTGATGRWLRSQPDPVALVALYLITSPPATMSGLYYCPLPSMAHEIGRSVAEVRLAMSALTDHGFCAYDDERELVWVREMLQHQTGGSLKPSDNRLKAIRSDLARYLQSPLIQLFLSRYTVSADSGVTPWNQAALKGLPRASVPVPALAPAPASPERSEASTRAKPLPLPGRLDPALWGAWLDHRRRIKAPMTDHAQRLLLGKLERWHGEGHDVRALLELSIERGWRGVDPSWQQDRKRHDDEPEPERPESELLDPSRYRR